LDRVRNQRIAHQFDLAMRRANDSEHQLRTERLEFAREREQIMHRFDDAVAEIRRLRAALQDLDDRTQRSQAELLEQLRQARTSAADLERQLQGVGRENRALALQLELANRNIARLDHDLRTSTLANQRAQEDLQAALTRAHREHTEATQALRRAIDEMRDQFAAELQVLRARNAELSRGLDQLAPLPREVAQLRDEITQVTRRNVELEGMILRIRREGQGEIAALRRELQTVSERARDAIHGLEQRLTLSEAQNRAAIDELRTQVATLLVLVLALWVQVQQLQAQHRDAGDDAARIGELEAEVQQLRGDLEATEESLAAALEERNAQPRLPLLPYFPLRFPVTQPLVRRAQDDSAGSSAAPSSQEDRDPPMPPFIPVPFRWPPRRSRTPPPSATRSPEPPRPRPPGNPQMPQMRWNPSAFRSAGINLGFDRQRAPQTGRTGTHLGTPVAPRLTGAARAAARAAKPGCAVM
jgi:outer membrane murein-binding lipoprotein Lpp